MTQKEFLELKLKKLKIKKYGHVYRIYKTAKEFIDIEADSVCHAIEESKIEKPIKVIFLGYTDIGKVLTQDDVETEDTISENSAFCCLDNKVSINNFNQNQDK